MSERKIRFRREPQSFVNVVTKGQKDSFGGDAYYLLLTMPWWRFFVAVAIYVMTINTLFAVVYELSPGCISNARGGFEDSFFFSVQTFATIGYGTMAPQTRFAHIIVTVESLVGILTVGSLAGISFARLSRPTARVLFSEKCVVRKRNGVPHLMMRMANWRRNLVVEANLRVFLLVREVTAEGDVTRSPVEVKLVRSSNPVFFLTWTAMHLIDESSPFYGEDAIERLREKEAQLYLLVNGFDQSMGQVVRAYKQYELGDILWNARFADVVTIREDRVRVIDFAKFHDVEIGVEGS